MFQQLLKNIIFSRFKKSVSSQKLEFSELRYRRLFETAQDGILILDASTGKITDANPFLKNLLGYSKFEFLGKELWEIGVFKDIVDSKKAFLELQEKGYIRYKDLPLETKDGRSIDVEFISNVYMVDTHKVIQCNIRNITDRKRAEEAVESRTKELEKLSRSQEETKKALLNVMEDLEQAKATIEIEKAKDEAMLASIGEGLIAFDNDRKIIVLNQSAKAMLGLKTEDFLGKGISSLSLEDEEGHKLSLDQLPIPSSSVSGAGSSQRFKKSSVYFFVRKDKTRFPIAINVTPIKLGSKVIGVLDIFRDITREREIDRDKSEFVSLASHQLRTPLGISKWYLEALQGEGLLDNISTKAKDYLSEVYKSNERLLALVRGLLSVSRIDQGTVRDTPKLVYITKLVKDVIREMSIIADKYEVSIDLKIKTQTIPPLLIDPFRAQQIIENILVNAIEYSNPGSRVEVLIIRKESKLLISVKDQGIGISIADQKKLFTKFFRSAKATTKNTEGSGLGLYVVKSYIEGWGGEIRVRSTEGKGSVFTIILPITKQRSLPKQK